MGSLITGGAQLIVTLPFIEIWEAAGALNTTIVPGAFTNCWLRWPSAGERKVHLPAVGDIITNC